MSLLRRHGRWYPTVTELNDGRMMTTSGLNETDGGNNNTSEIWDGQHWSAEIAGNPNISDFRLSRSPCIPECTCYPPATFSIFSRRQPRSTLTLPPELDAGRLDDLSGTLPI